MVLGDRKQRQPTVACVGHTGVEPGSQHPAWPPAGGSGSTPPPQPATQSMIDLICAQAEMATPQVVAAIGAGGERAQAAVAALLLPQYTCSGGAIAQFNAVLDRFYLEPEFKGASTAMR